MTNLSNILLILFFIFLTSCSEKISYSGKVISFESEKYNKFKYKNEVLNLLGDPSYIDPIEKKYFYFTEKKITKNFFDSKITERKLIIFQFNSEESIISINEYFLDDYNEISLIKEKTPDEIFKRGMIEKIFGGIGKTSSQTGP